MENSLTASQKVNIELPIPLLGIHPTELKTHIHKQVLECSWGYNSTKVETAQVCIS